MVTHSLLVGCQPRASIPGAWAPVGIAGSATCSRYHQRQVATLQTSTQHQVQGWSVVSWCIRSQPTVFSR
eukprot:jgi/Chlat1/5476/Chrsp36S05430